MKRLLLTLPFVFLQLSMCVAQRSANVVFIGNSITYGALHKEPGQTAPPAQCARWLSAQEGIDTIYFRNCGKSGRTTYHFLPREEDVVPAGDKTQFGEVVKKTRQLVNEHPGLPLLFSIMLGTNDTVERRRNAHTSPEDYANNLCTIIDSLLRLWPYAHVVLNKPIWYTPDYVTKNGSVASKKSLKLIGEYEKMFPEVVRRCKAGQVHIGDSEAYDYFRRHWKTDINEEKDARGKSYWLHPNEQGAGKLAEFWGKALLQIIGPAPSPEGRGATAVEATRSERSELRKPAAMEASPSGGRLEGAKLGIIGDSYVRNHREPVENTWHYKFAKKHGMEYYNYGRNGNCIALDLERWGTGMYKRYTEMREDLDYVVVIAGHNDASPGRVDSIGMDVFKERLGILCQGLKERYPQARIFFFTPWTCEDFAGSMREKVVDAMLEVCGSHDIPVFDAARRSNILADSEQFRKVYFQGGKGTDTAHLNSKGHDRFLPVAERFILQTGVADGLKGIWPVTDRSMMKSLNGEWQLKVVEGIGNDHSVPETDTSWGTIPVPGCWEAYGFCEPRYDYPDSLTGYYRTAFTIPAAWRGQHVVLRLDGVLRGYDLWLNGMNVGTWESAYNTCHFDLTPYLTERAFEGEEQQLAMRVYSRFKGYEFDCFDDWAAMGIFRDVTLCAIPDTHLSDLTVTTKMNGEVTVDTKVANATVGTSVSYEIKDALGTTVSTGGKIENPHLWTAETPYLYTLYIYIREKDKLLQTVTEKIGIREIAIDGNVLKLNGRPIKLRGVNAHSTDPQTVKVIGDDLTLKDMRLMKEASVNYMRLSHYPREPRFYELADSLGFYLVDEVPFGFGDKHLSSRSYQDILKSRALATVQRDKIHPSVIVWSVGNENPLPQTCVEVGDYVASLDPSRPYCFPQVGSYFRKFWEKAGVQPSEKGPSPFPSKAPVYAPHYPTTGQMGGFYQHLDRPVIFTEYCHTLGISFEDHDRQWDIIERTPGIAGGSVWEWADQGMPFTINNKQSTINNKQSTINNKQSTINNKQSTINNKQSAIAHKYGYEEKVYTSHEGGFEMNGNKGTDGLLYADRTPLPNYYELQHNYARAFVEIDNGKLIIDNSAAQKNLQSSIFNLQCHNRYDFLNLKDNVIFHWHLTADRDTVASGDFSPDCPPRSSVSYPLSIPQAAVPSDSHKPLTLLHFDIEDTQGHTFLHQSFVLSKPEWKELRQGMKPMKPSIQRGPLVRAGRKPTMAERIKQEGRLPQRYLLPADNAEVKADVHVAPAEGGQRVSFTLLPDTADVFRSELGLAWLLDKRIDRVQWIGQGPFASYPGRHQACRYGLWAKRMDDLYFEGNHSGIDAALLTDSVGNGILVVGDSLHLNFEQTDRGLVLTVNAAVSGQGPKFAKTAFNAWKPGDKAVGGECLMYGIRAGKWPEAVSRLFGKPDSVPAPFKPFLTQYDTYLMRYADIAEE